MVGFATLAVPLALSAQATACVFALEGAFETGAVAASPARTTSTAGAPTLPARRSAGGSDPVNALWALDVDSGTERLVADPRALRTLRTAGYDLTHSGRQITTEWFLEPGRPDLLLTMDSSNYATVIDLAPDEAARERVRMMRSFDPALAGLPAGDPRLDVPDPWYGDHDGFSDVLAMLEAAADVLVADLPLLVVLRCLLRHRHAHAAQQQCTDDCLGQDGTDLATRTAAANC